MKKFWPLIALTFVLYVSFMAALVGQAELDGGDDYYHISVAQSAPWREIFRGLLGYQPPHDPLGAGVVNHALSSRVGQTLTLKLQQELFGAEPLPYFMVQTAVGGLCMVLIAWIVKKLTRTRRWALFAALYYMLLPSALEHNTWLSDYAETIHLMALVSFICVYKLYQRRRVHLALGPKDVVLGLTILAATLYALKSKSTGFVIPVMLAFSLIYYGVFRPGKAKRLPAILGVVLIGALLLFPLLKQLAHAEIRWERILEMLIMNRKSGYESETAAAFFDLHAVLPVSLARNIGFFFLWLAIFSSVQLLRKNRLRPRAEVIFLLAWLGVEISLFSLVDSQIRYLTGAMLPTIILLSLLFSHTWRNLNAKTGRAFFAIFFLAGILFLSINNFQHLVFLRNWKLGYFNELNKPTAIIYNDMGLRPLDGRLAASESVRFAHPEFVMDIREKLLPNFLPHPPGDRIAPPYLPDILAFSDIRDLHYRKYDDAETSRILKRFGKAYGISYTERQEEGFTLLKSFRQVPYSPIVELLERLKKKKQTKHIFIYKRVSPKVAATFGDSHFW